MNENLKVEIQAMMKRIKAKRATIKKSLTTLQADINLAAQLLELVEKRSDTLATVLEVEPKEALAYSRKLIGLKFAKMDRRFLQDLGILESPPSNSKKSKVTTEEETNKNTVDNSMVNNALLQLGFSTENSPPSKESLQNGSNGQKCRVLQDLVKPS